VLIQPGLVLDEGDAGERPILRVCEVLVVGEDVVLVLVTERLEITERG